MENVLDAVDVTPGRPFEVTSQLFGVRVEEPPDMHVGWSLLQTKYFLAIYTKLMMRLTTANSELPPASVALAMLLQQNMTTGNQYMIRIASAINRSDSLFQQRDNFTVNNNQLNVLEAA